MNIFVSFSQKNPPRRLLRADSVRGVRARKAGAVRKRRAISSIATSKDLRTIKVRCKRNRSITTSRTRPGVLAKKRFISVDTKTKK